MKRSWTETAPKASGRSWHPRARPAIGPLHGTGSWRRVEQLADLIVGNLDIIGEALEEGSLVVLGEGSHPPVADPLNHHLGTPRPVDAPQELPTDDQRHLLLAAPVTVPHPSVRLWMFDAEIEGLPVSENADWSTRIASAWTLPRDAGTIPGARRRVLDDQGHRADKTNPILVGDLIRTFVSTGDPGLDGHGAGEEDRQ